jgi:hypothetical protein
VDQQNAERDTVKHDPRLDEAMASEDRSFTTGAPVEARTDSARVKEIDDPAVDPSARAGTTTSATLSAGEVKVRAALANRLAGADFPADRDALIRHLGEADERSDLVTRMRMLPRDRVFTGVREVLNQLSGV